MGKKDLSQFDWRRVGELDAEMWRAYYNHQFFRLFRLLLLLIKKQLGFGWLTTVRVAFYSARAAMRHRAHQQDELSNPRVVADLAMFYKIISDRSTRPFDYRQAAELDMAWWAIDRTSQKNRTRIEAGIAEASAVVHSVGVAKLKDHAHYRVEAMFAPVKKGDKRHFDRTDWVPIEELTMKSWHELWTAVQR